MAADLKGSELPAADALTGDEATEFLLGVQAGTTKRFGPQNVANLARLAPVSITDSGNTDLTRAAHFNRLVICSNASPITLGYALDSVGLTSDADDLFVRNDGPGTVTIQAAAISPGTVIGLDGTSTVLVPVNTIVSFQRTAADTLRQVDRTLATTGQATAGVDNSTLMTPALTALAIAAQATTPEPSPTGNALLSGGGVAFTSGLDLVVSASEYLIQGVGYDSLETPLTATTADGTNPRIDVVVVDSSGAASIIAGTPAANPAKPDVDPETQLELTFFLVAAGATALPVSVTDVYHENSEWTTSRSGTSFTLASTNNPRAGSVCVEGTAVPTNDYWQATGPGDIDLASKDNLVFYIRSKATWVATRSLSITARKTNTQKGSIVTFKHGTFGFDSSNTSAYQQIVIPLSLFGANGLAVDRFRFASAGTGTALGCYMDDVTLQGGLSATTDASRMKWRGTYSASLLYQVNDVVLSSGIQYVCIQAGTGQTPASSATYWQASTAAGGGSGTVTHTTGALTASALIVGNGADDLKPLASLGTTTTVLHGNAAGLPTFGAVSLSADVTGTLGITSGGTGRATGTTAYALVATGTTATGVQQTLAAGATTEILVGGGASALPVWTTAQGSGAPVRATSPTLTTPLLGTPTSGNLSNCTADGTDAVGFRNIPANSQSTAYTGVLADAGKSIDHPSTDANARTMTIPANASVAYPVGTTLSFSNMTSQVVTIAITTDTMYLAGTGTTGSRSLAQYGTATARKLTSTTWLISGVGLT